MENKKLGGLLIVISLVVGIIFLIFINQLYNLGNESGCYNNPKCKSISINLNLSHLAVGVAVAILSLGVYLIFFNKGDEAILKRLEEEKNKKLDEDKFELISKGLDDNEKKVLNVLKEQDGITQSTLRIKTGLSKSKVSQILSDFERKNLVKREKKGKTLSVRLRV